jgi:hypothetical protein
MSKWLLSLTLLALAGSAGVTYVQRLEPRSREIEGRQRVQSERLALLTRELTTLKQELKESDLMWERFAEGRKTQAVLQSRIDCLEEEFVSTRTDLDQQSGAIAQVGVRQDEWAREESTKRLEMVNKALDERWSLVSESLEATARIAAHNRDNFDNLLETVDRTASDSPRDIAALWADLMGPTVQISDESTVGSGILLPSTMQASGEYRTYLLTAWHVIRDILGETKNFEAPIQVFIYHEDTERTEESAMLVDYDANLDTALLLLTSTTEMDHGARFPSRERLDELSVFTPIYAVGCPLGNDPIPTYGEIADTNHHVDGDHYWMINAPTYIGNSGGGIFDSETHELLGVFSKIYTHGNLRPTVVPHMGLVTPLSAIYDWLEEVGQAHILPD